MASIFSKIVAGEIPCHRIAESDDFLAFLDIQPVQTGHTLVIPKKEIDYLFDLEDEHLAALMQFAKKVAQGLRKSVPCNRIGVTVIGLEVPHAHVHLIPINSLSDMDFTRPKKNVSHDELAHLAEHIRSFLDK
ncbi:MAG TPA: HIT family protein [Saprospiraceae bacterium]|nr:HIT family protein [Saprospiraceae bacterium]MCB9272066.1 HIT family protein [Lewinellaceae bacterium]HPG07107.1 HIT family protein [Saprospiraceae bacterium]HPQ97914.1 HIT family protein [Saprospiraceae bacterium]HQU55236.1 HIT family protein [Saprospiraceae bacterium]